MEHLAIDIGASGGKVFSGGIPGPANDAPAPSDKLRCTEIHRFENRTKVKGGHCFWDLDYLFGQVLRGLKKARARGITECTVGIDAWGVDYVLLDGSGERIGDAYCYRDDRTDRAMEKVFGTIGREKIFEKTGIQFLPFNTLYQLAVHDPGELAKAARVLLIPDYLNFLLTGRSLNEETIASTTQLLDCRTREFDPELLAAAGVGRGQFAELARPPLSLGPIRGELRLKYDLPACEVVGVASHDTASAVLGVPFLEKDSIYVSSGTWSLLGIERSEPLATGDALRKNVTNEWGAFGTFRILKNLSGLWLVQELRRELGGRDDYEALMKKAEACEAFRYVIDCNDPAFLHPASMADAIGSYCRDSGQGAPASEGELVRCAVESLALLYRATLEELEALAGFRAGTVRVVGGGSRNGLLNALTADVTGRKVAAGPAEATALGNIVMQMIGSGELDGPENARRLVGRSFAVTDYFPRVADGAEEAYGRFERLRARTRGEGRNR